MVLPQFSSLDVVVDFHPFPIVVLDSEASVLFNNPAALRLSQFLEKEQKSSVWRIWLEGVKHEGVGQRRIELGDVVFNLHVNWHQQSEQYLLYGEDVTWQDTLTGQLDKLTNLNTLKPFTQHVEKLFHHRDEYPLVAIIIIDINRFKEINIRHGYYIGDILLKLFADRLKAMFVEKNLARISGNEFAVLVSPEHGLDELKDIVSQCYQSCCHPFIAKGNRIHMQFSFGVATTVNREAGLTAQQLIDQAFLAVDTARREQSPIKYYSTGLLSKFKRKHQLREDLLTCLRQGEMNLLYQPQVLIAGKRTIGAEALIRWQHPKLGAISPMEFIPIAEDAGIISKVTTWVIKTVFQQLMKWHEENIPLITISVNISPNELMSRDILYLLESLQQQNAYVLSFLELEITESVLLKDFAVTASCLKSVRELGVQIAIDDFGTGYSSLSYLSRLPIDKLKIDRSFVSSLDKPGNQIIINSMIELAQRLRIKSCAEGVETSEQLAYLSGQGCDQAQGFFFSPPVSIAKLNHYLQAEPATAQCESNALA